MGKRARAKARVAAIDKDLVAAGLEGLLGRKPFPEEVEKAFESTKRAAVSCGVS